MYSLRWYQQEAVSATWDFLRNHSKSPVIVLPTGAGKSLVIAELCREAVTLWQGRIVVLAHRKELLEQNAEKIRSLLPNIQVGVYSAGLRQRDFECEIVCAGIQSIYQKAHILGRRDLVIVDEAHLVPDDGEGMYRQFLVELSGINTHARMVGLTATPFRTGVGPICSPDNLFHKICYDAPMQRLIAEGYLCPLTNKSTAVKFDLSDVKIRGGEYVARDMEAAFDRDQEQVAAAVADILGRTKDRHSVLIFCAGVQHAEHVAGLIAASGQDCGLVTGQSTDLERSMTLSNFRAGRLKYLCNVNVLTTGYDAPCIDAIVVLRATCSPGLFAQICGRGLRVDKSKVDCLLLDYGGNLERHGAIDSPSFGGDAKKGGKPGEAPTKECPNCKEENAIQATICIACGFAFPRNGSGDPKHADSPDDSSQVFTQPEKLCVMNATAVRHQKKGVAPGSAPDTMRVIYSAFDPSATYDLAIETPCIGCGETGTGVIGPGEGPHFATLRCRCGAFRRWLPSPGNLAERKISEWVCFDHQGFARTKAENWWMAHSDTPVPASVAEALAAFDMGACLVPKTITIQNDGKYDRIIGREFVGEKPTVGVGDAWDGDWMPEQPAATVAEEDIPF